MREAIKQKSVFLLIIFCICLILPLSFGYPRIFLNDEWISVNQLNHLMNGKDLLYGYEPYGERGYAEGHDNILSYTLALPIVSIPVYLFFTTLGDNFRLFINILWLGLILFSLLLIHRFFPKYTLYKNIPWTYGVFGSSLVLFIMNMWLYTPFPINQYPEIAAITSTNNILFAGSMVLVFLICQKIFQNDWWSLFGVVSVVCGSSYLFWSEVGKDHIITLFLFLISFYFFISWIESGDLLHLISSYIGVGWVAWVRPDVGSGLLLLSIIAGIILTYDEGIVEEIKTLFCSIGTVFGALPLFINNYALTGDPFVAPIAIRYQEGFSSSVEVLNEMLATNYYAGIPNIAAFPDALFHVLFDPLSPRGAGFFQVSPFSFLALFCIGYFILLIIQKKKFFDNEFEKKAFIGIIFISLGLIIPQINNIIQLGRSSGIVPDIRYLSSLYFPMILLGLFFLKKVKMNEKDVKKTLESFFWIGLFTLPFSLIILQAFIGTRINVQLQIQQWINYVFLIVVCISLILIITKKMKKECLRYILPLMFISNCIWFLIVGYRFTSGIWQHYHFWLPVTNWTRLIFFKIFPW